VNTHSLELVNHVTAKDQRERAWKGAVVRSFQMHSKQLTCEKQTVFLLGYPAGRKSDTKLNGIKSGDANRMAWTLQI